MPELIVTHKGLHYAGKSYDVGERFTATPVDATYLKKTRRAEDAPAAGAVVATANMDRHEARLLQDLPDETAPADAQAQRYRTRRLKTED